LPPCAVPLCSFRPSFKVRGWMFDACHAVAIRRRRVRCSYSDIALHPIPLFPSPLAFDLRRLGFRFWFCSLQSSEPRPLSSVVCPLDSPVQPFTVPLFSRPAMFCYISIPIDLRSSFIFVRSPGKITLLFFSESLPILLKYF